MWARLNENKTVAETIAFNPEGLFHESIVWVEVPQWLELYIDATYQWDEATQSFQHARGYKDALDKAKVRTEVEHFDVAFAEIEYKRGRSVSMVTESQALGFPQADYAEDLNILGQINMVAEENRTLLRELKVLTIAENATLEEAQTALKQSQDMRPWLPWNNNPHQGA